MFGRSLIVRASIAALMSLATLAARAQKHDDLFEGPLPPSNAQHWKDLETLVERFQPEAVRGRAEAPNGYLLFKALGERLEVRLKADWEARREPYDFDAIATPSPETAGGVENARRALAEYEQLGFFDAIDEIGRAERVARPPSEGSLVGLLLPHLGQSRTLTRALAARFETALAQGRPADAMREFDRMLALGRVQAFGPTIIERLVANAIVSKAADHLRAAIVADKLGPEHLTLAAESMARRLGDWPPLTLAIEGERLIARDSIDIVYSSAKGVPQDLPNHRRLAVVQAMSMPEGRMNINGAPGLATAKELRERAERAYDQMARAAMLPRARRVGENSPSLRDDLGGREIVLQVVLAEIDKFLSREDQFATDLEATRAMVALERFRVRTGAYPETLAALTPADLPATPIDAWSGESLRYRREGEAYRLYSTGIDGKDDGGKDDPKDINAATKGSGAGIDAVYR